VNIDELINRWAEASRKLAYIVFGELWFPIIRDTFRDAVGIYIVLSIGKYTGKIIAGKNFSSFAECSENAELTSADPYVCYIVVVLNFVSWAGILGRLLYRALRQFLQTFDHVRSQTEREEDEREEDERE
jgi:hypothetical protein